MDISKSVPKAKRCSYPGCNQEFHYSSYLKSFNNNEVILFNFCPYHFYIVMGGHFSFINSEEGEKILIGPFREVEIAEQVISAREMMKGSQKQ